MKNVSIAETETEHQRLIADIYHHLSAEWAARRLPASGWPSDLAKRLQAAVAGSGAVVPSPFGLHDDITADTLATAMKAKLARKRSQGYGGWQDAAVSRQHLSNLLRRHVEKGDPVDVANFCAFLHARGEFIAPPADPLDPKDAKVGAACNRACIELPPHYEVVISLEKDAGTVHWFDADGNEHSAYADGGFDESINAATDAAIARARESVSE